MFFLNPFLSPFPTSLKGYRPKKVPPNLSLISRFIYECPLQPIMDQAITIENIPFLQRNVEE